MAEGLLSGADREDLQDGARYVLPGRGPRGGAYLRLAAAVLLLGLSAWIGLGIAAQLRRTRPDGFAFALGLAAGGSFLAGGMRLAWTAWRALNGRFLLEVRGGRVWSGVEWRGRRSGEESAAQARIVGIDVVEPAEGRQELVFTFAGGGPISLARGWPPRFLRQFRDELRARHLPSRPAPVPHPPPAAPAPIAVPRPPGPGVRPAPPPVARRKGDTGIEFLSDPAAAATTVAVGECQVCGTPMTADLVACQKCRTPHHRSCWEYMRRCSTYGCGGTRSVAAGPVAKEEEVLVIRGGGAHLKRRFLRDWMLQVAAEQRLGEVRSREKKHRHCEASFEVEGLFCDLVGRKQGDRFEFVILASLRTRDDWVAAESVPVSASLRRQVVGRRLELRPAASIDSLARLRAYVAECLGVVREVARVSSSA